jgi:hypothetical protein
MAGNWLGILAIPVAFMIAVGAVFLILGYLIGLLPGRGQADNDRANGPRL